MPEEPGVAEAKHAEEEEREAAPEPAGWREAKAEPATPGHRALRLSAVQDATATLRRVHVKRRGSRLTPPRRRAAPP